MFRGQKVTLKERGAWPGAGAGRVPVFGAVYTIRDIIQAPPGCCRMHSGSYLRFREIVNAPEGCARCHVPPQEPAFDADAFRPVVEDGAADGAEGRAPRPTDISDLSKLLDAPPPAPPRRVYEDEDC